MFAAQGKVAEGGGQVPVSMEGLELGTAYGRKALASLWGYKNWRAFSLGVFCPKGQKFIILFVTEKKRQSLTQYVDYFAGDLLHWEG